MLDRITGYKRLLALAALNGGGASIIERTATGNPLTFETDLARPLKSLLIPFSPKQSGTGDPSPSNVRDIVPWNGLTVWQGGKNLLQNKQKERASTSIYIGQDTSNEYPVHLVGGAKYTLTFSHDGNKTALGYIQEENGDAINIGSGNTETFTAPKTMDVRIYIYVQGGVTTISDFMLEVGETATAYEPYKPITDTDIVFPSPVYGGILDVVSGVLTVEWAKISFKWGDCTFQENLGNNTRKIYDIRSRMFVNGSDNSMCNVTNVYYNNNSSDTVHYYINSRGDVVYMVLPNDLSEETEIEICAKLLTPQEVTLSPEQITALLGQNTIWSDADGSMTAVYLVSAAYADSNPVGGLGSGLLGGGFGSGSGEPDEPVEPDEPGEPDQPDEPAEPDQPGDE